MFGRLDPASKTCLPVVEALIIQESFNQVRVRYVPDKDFSTIDGSAIVERLKGRLVPVQIILEPVETIPRELNGNFRAVICKISKEELETLRMSGTE